MKLESVSLITGISFCLEYVAEIPADDIPNVVIFDFAIFRFIFTVGQN